MALKLIRVFPALPFFVVIRITPFAALEPYKDAAAASFKTVIFSISLGLIEDIILNDLLSPLTGERATSPETTGTPSTTYRGSLVAFIEPVPLTRISNAAPGCPLLLFIVKPGVVPARACSKEVTGISFKAFAPSTEAAAPVNEDFLAVP